MIENEFIRWISNISKGILKTRGLIEREREGIFGKDLKIRRREKQFKSPNKQASLNQISDFSINRMIIIKQTPNPLTPR